MAKSRKKKKKKKQKQSSGKQQQSQPEMNEAPGEPSSEQAEDASAEEAEATDAKAEQAEDAKAEQTVEMTPEELAKAEARAKDVELTEDGDERRRRYRLNKVLGATLTSSSGDVNKSRLFVIDISATGFRATDHTPHTESEYEIEIILSKGAEPFKSKMRVVWSKELTVSGMFQMGCEFLDISPDEKERLESFVEGERYKLENAPKKPIDLGRPWTMIK